MNISGYSTALFSTWFYAPEWQTLFDCGDGVSAALHQKAHGIKHVFISHADRDHLGGLFQFLQLNSRGDLPNVYYPADCGSFPAIENFLARFDPHTTAACWHPLENGQQITVAKGVVVTAVTNGHIASDSENKSFSFRVESHKRKLKPELAHLPGDEIARLRQDRGESFITAEVRQPLFGYSGDTPVGIVDHWSGVPHLIHEATFLDTSEIELRGNRHSCLSDVLQMARQLELPSLVLSHFSARYKVDEIYVAVRRLQRDLKLRTELRVIPPGEFVADVLALEPVS